MKNNNERANQPLYCCWRCFFRSVLCLLRQRWLEVVRNWKKKIKIKSYPMHKIVSVCGDQRTITLTVNLSVCYGAKIRLQWLFEHVRTNELALINAPTTTIKTELAANTKRTLYKNARQYIYKPATKQQQKTVYTHPYTLECQAKIKQKQIEPTGRGDGERNRRFYYKLMRRTAKWIHNTSSRWTCLCVLDTHRTERRRKKTQKTLFCSRFNFIYINKIVALVCLIVA